MIRQNQLDEWKERATYDIDLKYFTNEDICTMIEEIERLRELEAVAKETGIFG